MNTPIESYCVGNTLVDVKRDDLFASPPSPPNAKMRGISRLLQELAEQGVTRVAVYDTRISEASWGVTVEAQKHRIQCTAYYPYSKYIPRSLEHVVHAGGKVEFVRHNITPICYQVAKKHAEQNGSLMLPFGLSTQHTVDSVAKEVVETIPQGHYRSVVLCSGSCTMLAGLITGFFELGGSLPQFYSVSAGASKATQVKSLKRWKNFMTLPVAWIPPQMDYYQECDCECPFPANRFYDCKAWKWLTENIREIEHPTLFWCIGGRA